VVDAAGEPEPKKKLSEDEQLDAYRLDFVKAWRYKLRHLSRRPLKIALDDEWQRYLRQRPRKEGAA
jgi:hypothetical protein